MDQSKFKRRAVAHNFMSRNYIVLASIFLAFAVIGCKHREIPIYNAIGLTPISDIKKNRGIDTYRELIYKNVEADRDFYGKIVKKIEYSSSIINNKCVKSIGLNRQGDFSKAGSFDNNDIVESTTFQSPGSQFVCIVSNGKKFILIILYTT